MRFVMFYHSLLSDWNHGNAHFLRGVVTELSRRGHEVIVYEPRDGWSLRNLVKEQGARALDAFAEAYPALSSQFYEWPSLDLGAALAGADVVVVHEWNDPALVNAIGEHRRAGGSYRLLFHDTHHRVVSDAASMRRLNLGAYDGVLAFGRSLAELYEARGWGRRVWVWHEAADTMRFRPRPDITPDADLVWVGNWGDDERAVELQEFLIGPVKRLGLRARVYGVRYPDDARRALSDAGIEYGGWLPNSTVPEVFARHRMTVHVPRRQYTRDLPGIPTIRPFEAMACGIPLVSAPWTDCEGLFVAGRDYLLAHDGREMATHLRGLLADPKRANALAAAGRGRIEAAHTCAHRVDQLLTFLAEDQARQGHATRRELAS